MSFSNEQGEPLTKDQLKVMALRERVAQITAEYEDRVADLRVELTFVSQELDDLRKSLNADSDSGIDNPPVYPSEAQEG